MTTQTTFEERFEAAKAEAAQYVAAHGGEIVGLPEHLVVRSRGITAVLDNMTFEWRIVGVFSGEALEETVSHLE